MNEEQKQPEPVAWVHEGDPDRVISAAQKAQALKDGGASASSVRPYSLAAVLIAQQPEQPAEEARTGYEFKPSRQDKGAVVWAVATMLRKWNALGDSLAAHDDFTTAMAQTMIAFDAVAAPAEEARGVDVADLCDRLRKRYGLECQQGDETFYDFGRHPLVKQAIRALLAAPASLHAESRKENAESLQRDAASAAVVGHFRRASEFGPWIECAAGDEGAVALTRAAPAAAQAQGLTVPQIAMLRALLVSIRPEFGAPGSRDADVARQQKRIDCALAILDQAAHSRQPEGAAEWFALVMGAAASLEDAANSIRDPDAQRVAASAAEHYRDKAIEAWNRQPEGAALTDQDAYAMWDEVCRRYDTLGKQVPAFVRAIIDRTAKPQRAALSEDEIRDMAEDFKSTREYALTVFEQFDHMGFARALLARASESRAEGREAAALAGAIRERILDLPRYSFWLVDGGVRRVPDEIGRWIERDAAAALCEPEEVDAALAAQKGE